MGEPIPGLLVLRGAALRLPLADERVDLVVTSPPYFALRAYGSGHPHELGAEPAFISLTALRDSLPGGAS